MTISRSQMERQLRMGGGIMNIENRQKYLFGGITKSIKKAVKGVTNAAKKVVKSPLGKAAILGAVGFGIPGTSIGGLFGRGAAAPGMFNLFGPKGTGKYLHSPVQGSGSILGKIGLSGSAGKAALGIGAASTLAGILASDAEMTEEEAEELKQDPAALRNYLRLYYSNLNPNASKQEVDSFVRTNMYADGGRVNYQQGSQPAPAPAPAQPGSKKPGLGSAQGSTPIYQNLLKYLQRSQAQSIPDKNKPQTISMSMSKPKEFDMSKYGGGFFGGGIEDTRNIALNNLASLGYDTNRFRDIMGLPSSPSSGPMPIGPGIGVPIGPTKAGASIFKDQENLARLMNPEHLNIGSGTLISALQEAKDIGRDYTIDEALNFTEEDIMEISDLYAKKNKIGKYTPIKSKALTTYTGPTNYKMVGGVAVPVDPPNSNNNQYVGGINYQSKLKQRNQFGGPPAGLARGGRVQYAMGSPEQNAMQAAGIMDLPLNQNKAGVTELDLRKSGGFIPPVGVKEKADDIPAMLSNNEFVFTADAVRGMGNGNVNKGAQRMYDMMKKLEKGGRV